MQRMCFEHGPSLPMAQLLYWILEQKNFHTYVDLSKWIGDYILCIIFMEIHRDVQSDGNLCLNVPIHI